MNGTSRSLRIIEKRPLAQKLVGFALDAAFAGRTPKECHLIIRDGQIAGRVSSVAHSSVVGHVVGLAMIAPDMAAPETSFKIRVDGGVVVEARVVATPFYDPPGDRQKPVAKAQPREAVAA